MNTYSTWQEVFIQFIEQFGHNYKDSYNLAVEFEAHLRQNRLGRYYLIEGAL